jgi:hypothetical protein
MAGCRSGRNTAGFIMQRPAHLPLAVAVTAAAFGVVLSGAVKFTSTWKSLDAASVSFAGKKVAALVIAQDDSLRVSGEEALVGELNARGMEGVATYRIAPKEELQDAERAKPWFERAQVEGVVAVRPVSVDTRTRYTPPVWIDSTYSTFWGYYGYGWSQVSIPISRGRETVVVVENTIYSVPRNALVWAAVSETTNPKDLQKFIAELVKASVNEMQKQGLAKRSPTTPKVD